MSKETIFRFPAPSGRIAELTEDQYAALIGAGGLTPSMLLRIAGAALLLEYIDPKEGRSLTQIVSISTAIPRPAPQTWSAAPLWRWSLPGSWSFGAAEAKPATDSWVIPDEQAQARRPGADNYPRPHRWSHHGRGAKAAEAAAKPDLVTSVDGMGGRRTEPASFSYNPNLRMRDGGTHTFAKAELVITATVPGPVNHAVLYPGWTGTITHPTKSSSVITLTNSSPIALSSGQTLAAFDAVGSIPSGGTHRMTINRIDVQLSGDILDWADPKVPKFNYGGVTIR